MTAIWWFILCEVFAIVGWAGGFCFGYAKGVRVTERRWAEDVDGMLPQTEAYPEYDGWTEY